MSSSAAKIVHEQEISIAWMVLVSKRHSRHWGAIRQRGRHISKLNDLVRRLLNPLHEDRWFDSFMQAADAYSNAMNAGSTEQADAIEKLRYVIGEIIADDPATAARASQEMVDKLTARVAEKLKT